MYDYQKIFNASVRNTHIQKKKKQVMKALVTSPNSKVIVLGKGNTPVILDTKEK